MKSLPNHWSKISFQAYLISCSDHDIILYTICIIRHRYCMYMMYVECRKTGEISYSVLFMWMGHLSPCAVPWIKTLQLCLKSSHCSNLDVYHLAHCPSSGSGHCASKPLSFFIFWLNIFTLAFYWLMNREITSTA